MCKGESRRSSDDAHLKCIYEYILRSTYDLQSPSGRDSSFDHVFTFYIFSLVYPVVSFYSLFQ